jgi:hypothetical protein
MTYDLSLQLFIRRAVWFSRAVLDHQGVQVFDEHEWHDRFQRFPNILTEIFVDPGFFEKLDAFPQDYLINSVVDASEEEVSKIKTIEALYINNMLSEGQRGKLEDRVSRMSISELRSAQLSVEICYDRLVSGLNSHNWYAQNPAMEVVMGNGPDGLVGLSERELIQLGRNVLQAADGKAKVPVRFIETLSKEPGEWPVDLIRGISFECFFNENGVVRLKDSELPRVAVVIDGLDGEVAEGIVNEIGEAVMKEGVESQVTEREAQGLFEIISESSVMRRLCEPIKGKALS